MPSEASPRPRTQLLLKLGVFLLLGAIVNVALIFGVLLRIDPQLTYSRRSESPAELRWPQSLPKEAQQIRVETSPSFGTDRVSYHEVFSINGRFRGGSVFAELCRTGWPFRSLDGGYFRDPESNEVVEDAAIFLNRSWQRDFWSIGVLPLRPLWPGFAINTIFYAAILWVMWFGPGKFRRFIRVHPGRCPACGYKIAEGVGPLCSECGHPHSLRRGAGL